MGALHILQVVDWAKYTLDEWLEQYGSWCRTERMKGGNRPNDLSTSQSYHLMCSTGAAKQLSSNRRLVCCEITDDEARAIGRILSDARNDGNWILKGWVDLLITHCIELKSQRELAEIIGISRESVKQDIMCAKAFLHGRHGFLKMEKLI